MVIVAPRAFLRPVGRVVRAAPYRILQTESVRVLQCERHDLVSQSDALSGVRVGDHDVERQTVGMPPQRVRSNTADVVNLGERRADTAGGQDGSDL